VKNKKKRYYKNHCWKCIKSIDGKIHMRCFKCGWVFVGIVVVALQIINVNNLNNVQHYARG
jgi:rRNA maturation endonuclease Nob1